MALVSAHVPWVPRWRGCAAKVAAGAVLAVMAAGCSGVPAAPRNSVTACAQVAGAAIRRHVTVTTMPAACRGLSQVEVNVAVGRALRAAAGGARGKVRQRQLIARDGAYLVGLLRAVPAPGPTTAAPLAGPAAAAGPAGPPSRTALNFAALAAWLVTVGLGLSMMARWITRHRRRGAQPGQSRRALLNFTHMGLALTGLLIWICYLVTGLTGLAWAACGLLIVVAGLGMTLVFPAQDRGPASPATALAGLASPASALARTAPRQARRAPVLIVAMHITVATATILLAILAAIGLSVTRSAGREGRRPGGASRRQVPDLARRSAPTRSARPEPDRPGSGARREYADAGRCCPGSCSSA
jgi:manganese efflux pump family protein